MLTAWKRIVAWCERYAPEVLAGLNPGATDTQIADAEAHLGVTFPDDLRELYRLHDGQKDWKVGGDGSSPLPVEEWLPLHGIVMQWSSWEELRPSGTFDKWKTEADAGISSLWWNPGWIPFTHNGSGDHLCVDVAPTEAGRIGQIIAMWHDDDARKIDAPSLTAWLEEIADKMESGELIYSVEEYGSVVSRNDIDEDEEWRGVGDGT